MDLRQLDEPDIKYGYFNNQEGYGYCFFNNKTKGTTLEVTIDFSGSRNIHLISPFNGFKPTLIVDPGELEIVIIESKD